MSPLEKASIVLGVVISTGAILRGGFAMASFFAELKEAIKSLTDAVHQLTERFNLHAEEMGTMRERVAALESWRQDEME